MTYYRIKQYCIANGLPPGKAEYVRKMILRLVQQKVAEAAFPEPAHLTADDIRKAWSELLAAQSTRGAAIGGGVIIDMTRDGEHFVARQEHSEVMRAANLPDDPEPSGEHSEIMREVMGHE